MNIQRFAIIDHLVYATPDLAASIAELESTMGVIAAPGGQHPGRGTRNALIALGPQSYLEVIGPDLQQPAPVAPRWFAIDSLTAPKLVTWAAKNSNLQELVSRAARQKIVLGPVAGGGRRRFDGSQLQWEFTDPETVVAEGIVPFFIDWGGSPHPANDAAAGCSLVEFRAEHPHARAVRSVLQSLQVDLDVLQASVPALIATVKTPKGDIELR